MGSFDTIPHRELIQCVARRIVDRDMLHLIKMWLKVPVEERDENGKPRVERREEQHLWHTTGRSHQSLAGQPVHEPFSEVLADHRTG